jgi:hypothetical protein
MPPKIQMIIEENNVCKFRSTCILNTFSIDENFFLRGGGGRGGFWSCSENFNKSKSRFTEIKI